MKATLNKPLIHKLFVGSLIFYALSGVSSLLNYAFYPVVARFVNTHEYGEIQFLVSMFTQLAVGFVVLNILAIIIGTELKNRDDQRKALHSLNLIAGSITAIITLLGAGILFSQSANLNLTSAGAIIALAMSLLINVPFTVAIGKLQGNNHFILSGLVGALGAFLKLVFSLLFVMAGYGVTGAIFGIFVGMLASLLVVEGINYFTNKKITYQRIRSLKYHLSHLAFIKNRAAVAMLAVTFITLLSSADSIASRLALTPTQAGQYAAVATITKIILAATSPLMWLALPPAIQRNRQKFLLYIVTTFVVSLVATISFGAIPAFFTQFIVGIDAVQFTGLTLPASIAMMFCAIAFITVGICICLGYLRRVMAGVSTSIAIFLITIVALTPVSGLLTASIYAQITTSLALITILLPKLLQRP